MNSAEYLQNSTVNIISSYAVRIITLKTDLEKVELVLDQAIPCGLLNNELVTNSIMYTLSNNSGGEVFIVLVELKIKYF